MLCIGNRWCSLEGPKETKEAYRKAFKKITQAVDELRHELEATYGAVDMPRGVASDTTNILAQVHAHKAWVTFLVILIGDIDIRLSYNAPNSGWLYLAESLLQEVDPDTAEMYSMQPREREGRDNDITSLSDELDRGDVLHMPPLTSSVVQTSTRAELRE